MYLSQNLLRKEDLMDRWLNKNSDFPYAVMRLMVGLLFACHGVQKLFGTLGGQSEVSNPMPRAAGIIEFVGGGLVAIGLWTSYAAFISSGEMAVAYSIAHAAKGFCQSSTKASSLSCTASSFCISHQGVWGPECRGSGQKEKHA